LTVNTPAVVTVAKTLDASTTSPIIAGQSIVYDLAATNTGGTAAANYAFYEVVPANTTYASITGATTNCTSGAVGGTLCTITIATVPAQSGSTPGTAQATITFSAADPIPQG